MDPALPADHDHDPEPTLRDLIDLLRRGLLLAAAVGIVAAAATYFVERSATPVYEAQATLVAATQDPNRPGFGTTLVTAPLLDANAYGIAVASRAVLASALQALDGRTPEARDVDGLQGALSVRAEGTTTSPLLRLRVRNVAPDRARDVANAVAAAAIRWDEQRATLAIENIIESLTAQIGSIDAELAAGTTDGAPVDGLQRARTDLALQLSSARALRSGAVGRLELLEGADAPRAPVSPRPLRSAAVAGLFGVLLVYGLLLLRGALDTRLRNLDALERASRLPVLAGFPKVTGRRNLPPDAAAYLRTAIGFVTAEATPMIVLVTSTGPGHGKSSVSMALAESFARLHYRVLLLDADLRRPVLGMEYGIDLRSAPTLAAALRDPQGAKPITIALGREFTLDLLPGFAAVANPTEMLRNHVGRLLQAHAQNYDVIVLDSAPVLPVADTLTIAPYATGVILAVSLPDAHRKQVGAAIKMLQSTGARMLGSVGTNLPKEHHQRKGYGYGYGYGYGAAPGPSSVAARAHVPSGAQRRPPTPPATARQADLDRASMEARPAARTRNILSADARAREPND